MTGVFFQESQEQAVIVEGAWFWLIVEISKYRWFINLFSQSPKSICNVLGVISWKSPARRFDVIALEPQRKPVDGKVCISDPRQSVDTRWMWQCTLDVISKEKQRSKIAFYKFAMNRQRSIPGAYNSTSFSREETCFRLFPPIKSSKIWGEVLWPNRQMDGLMWRTSKTRNIGWNKCRIQPFGQEWKQW